MSGLSLARIPKEWARRFDLTKQYRMPVRPPGFAKTNQQTEGGFDVSSSNSNWSRESDGGPASAGFRHGLDEEHREVERKRKAFRLCRQVACALILSVGFY